MSNDNSGFDEVIEKLKKRRIVIIGLVLFAIVTGLAKFTDSVDSLTSRWTKWIADPESNPPGDSITNSPPADKGESIIAQQQSARVGRRPLAGTKPFSILPHYTPTGKLGDTEDIDIQTGSNAAVRFVCHLQGRGPHEWDYKYINGQENREPARFVGVMFLNPPDNWGRLPGGWDLRGYERIRWQGRSLGDDVAVEFVVGGVTWEWACPSGKWERATVPYPDTLPRVSLGTRTLTKSWQEFTVSFRDLGVDTTNDALSCVVAAFGLVLKWPPRKSPDSGDVLPRPVSEFEIREVMYEH